MKYFLIVLSLFVFSLGSAQSENEKSSIFDRKHEVRLGAIKMLSGLILETSYERILNSNSGYGVSMLINFNPSNEYFENYSLSPFYRMYFQSYEDYGAKGFFVEGFTSVFAGKNYFTYDYNTGNYENENFVDASIGLALGKKWINTSGFVFEIKAGVGRNLFGNSEFEALFKGDLYIGYRF